ncbi:hypothetical protein [Candidatus Hodarchaeum mangrovi]
MLQNYQENNFFVGSLITSIVGAAALILADFAGWYWSNYYLGVEGRGWLDVSFDNLLVAPFLLTAAILLLLCSYISFIALRGELPPRYLQYSKFAALISIGMQFTVAFIFIVFMLFDESEWWFDFGFYGGFIGAILTFVLLNFASKSNK